MEKHVTTANPTAGESYARVALCGCGGGQPTYLGHHGEVICRELTEGSVDRETVTEAGEFHHELL